MMNTTIKNSRLDSERFGERGRHYFIDLLQAKNNKPYLQITRSDVKDQRYERSTIILFEEDFGFLVEALSMVLTRYAHGERGTA